MEMEKKYNFISAKDPIDACKKLNDTIKSVEIISICYTGSLYIIFYKI